jgi:hypothetical protein
MDISETPNLPKPKHPGGRPRWQEPDPKQIEGLAARGLTLQQIALNLGISHLTLLRRRKSLVSFEKAIETGRAQAVFQVANTLFNMATSGNCVAASIYWMKIWGGRHWRQDQNYGVEMSGEVKHTVEDERTKQLRILRALTPEQRDELRRLQEAQDALIREALGPQEIEQTEQRAIETTARPVESSNGAHG